MKRDWHRPVLCLAAVVSLGLVAASPVWCAPLADRSRPSATAGPTPVRVYLYVADVYNISGADQSFGADVVLVAEWHDPRLAARGGPAQRTFELDDVWHPQLQIVNQRGATALLPPRVEVDEQGLVRYRQRWSGRFTARMDLRDFPLDRQQFRIQIVSLGHARDEVDLIPDLSGTRSGLARQLSITDWRLGRARMAIADYERAPGATPLAAVDLDWDGQRHVTYYAVQIVLPLILIVLMGWAAVWVAPSVVAVRMTVVVTTMLTLIAYRFAMAQSVPNLNYLTRFDYFTLGATVLVFLMLMIVAATAYLFAKGKTTLVDRIDLGARLAFPVVFAATCILPWL